MKWPRSISAKHEVVARWPLAPGTEPSGIALDAAHHRLFATCNNKLMVMLDTETGKVVGTVPIGAGTDGCAFDRIHPVAFASCGEGVTTIAKEESPEKLTRGANPEDGARRADDGARSDRRIGFICRPRNSNRRQVPLRALRRAGRRWCRTRSSSLSMDRPNRRRPNGWARQPSRIRIRSRRRAYALWSRASALQAQGGPPMITDDPGHARQSEMGDQPRRWHSSIGLTRPHTTRPASI